MNKKKSTALKTAVMSFAAIATSLTFGLTACTKTDDTTGDDDKTVTKIDSQTIKNGNFEFYSDNDGLYPISSPDSWTSGTTGNSSSSMSGVINTSKERWDYITNPELPEILENNDDLEAGDEDKKDYNGALTDDLPFVNPRAATDTDASDEDLEYISNPFTHSYRYDEDGKLLDNDGNEVTTYADEDGVLYLDEDLKTPLETSVLMIHNYRAGYYTGTESYFNSSTTITLEAGTACEISLWVKTDALFFDGTKAERTEVASERGAYIKVNTQVGGNSLDSFEIKNINTQKLNPQPEEGEWENNGWVQYTVYVEASTFADTTVNLTLGLGESDIYTVEGYAFFDDISFTKYLNKAELTDNSAAFGENITDNNTSYPLEPNAKNEFRVDTVTYQTTDENGDLYQKVEENYSNERYFFIDFASTTDTEPLTFGSSNIKAGLTVEETSTGKFVSSKGTYTNTAGKLDNDASTAFIPTKLPVNGIDVSDDLIGTTTVTGDENWSLGLSSDYNNLLSDALKTAVSLPGAGSSTDAMYILSAMGAAYEAQITDPSFSIADGEYMLITFWIKTSDMNGSTAATIKAVDVDDSDNASSSFNVDSTTVSLTSIGDIDDVYNGWVKCFVRVENNSKDTENNKQFKLVVNFGNTTIKGTTSASYKAGWLAIANMSVMNLDKDVYGYSSSASRSTTLSFTETVNTTNANFDTEQGDKNVIKNDLATPSSYTGVYGNSINVKPTGEAASDYDKTNANEFAGLLNKYNVENYSNTAWFETLRALSHAANGADANDVWNSVFGKYTVQPILIVNKVNNFADGLNRIYNYGYIASSSSSISPSGCTAVSVRVKVSANAIANIYLIDTDSKDNGVMTYALPKYNFWYDDDGNILKGEPDEDATAEEKAANIAYTLRDDGLYENGDGKLYANFYNLTKYYDLRYEHETFYNESGEIVRFEDLVQGETYYANAQKTAYAPHHLIAGGIGNNKVYEYKSGTGNEVTYYYMENQEANTAKVVYGVDTTVAKMRYDNTATENIPYQFTIDTTTPEGKKYVDQWVTVTFYILAGSKTKNYRLELWSGARDEQSSYTAGTNESYVIFDYSSYTVDETSFAELRDEYVNEILAEYRENVEEGLENNENSIADFEKLLGTKSDIFDYVAKYYTFSLYDSAAFIPFNAETADSNQTGYSFVYSDYTEDLAFLKVSDDRNMNMSAFIDYSVVDKNIDIIGEPTPPASDDTTTTTDQDPANVWLLVTSIVLVAAIFVAIASIFIRFMVKKFKRNKTAGKNSYNFNKNKRYVKKYVKANGEAPVIAEDKVDESLLSDKPEEAPATEETSTATDEDKSATAEEASEPSADEAQTTADEVKADEAKGDGDKNESEEAPSDSKPDNGDSEN